MFCGEYYHTIDAKGRMIIPAKFREILGEEFKVTKDIEGKCLYIYSMDGWSAVEEELGKLPSNETGMRIKRRLIGGSMTLELDKQGRILLPVNMREFAGLEKEIALVGVGEHIEVWDMQRWKAEMAPENNGDMGDMMSTYEIHL